MLNLGEARSAPLRMGHRQSAFASSSSSTPCHCRSDSMCFFVIHGVLLVQLKFWTNEISLTRSGDRVDSGTRLISPLGCGEKIRQSTEVGLMGLRAHTTRPALREMHLFLWKKHQTPLTKEGRCLHLCSSSPIPLVPAMPSPTCSRPQDPIDQFRILCSNLWPDSPPPRLDGCTHVGGLEPLFGAMAAPRQDEAKLGAKLQCILTQTCSPPRVTGNGRQPEQICDDAVSVVARGSPRRQDVSRCGGRRAMDDPRPEHLDSFAETAPSWHPIF